MIADPWISQLFQISNTQFFAQEIGDPVEDDSLGYEIKVDPYPSVLCSDFVTPRWFVPGSEGYVLDHCKKVTTPLDILPGGYMSVFTSGHGWSQVYARTTEEGKIVDVTGSQTKKGTSRKFTRSHKYGRDRGHLRHFENIIWGDKPHGDQAADYSTK